MNFDELSIFLIDFNWLESKRTSFVQSIWSISDAWMILGIISRNFDKCEFYQANHRNWHQTYPTTKVECRPAIPIIHDVHPKKLNQPLHREDETWVACSSRGSIWSPFTFMVWLFWCNPMLQFKIYNSWLVVWNILYFPIYLEFHHPNWLIFFRRVETTNQNSFWTWKMFDSLYVSIKMGAYLAESETWWSTSSPVKKSRAAPPP